MVGGIRNLTPKELPTMQDKFFTINRSKHAKKKKFARIINFFIQEKEKAEEL